MADKIPRRTFLLTAPATVGALAQAVKGDRPGVHGLLGDARDASPANLASHEPPSAEYTPVADYPIRPTPYSAVAVKDEFWRPKIERNAAVTIPFEMRKLMVADGHGGLLRGVLEAAIMSLAVHPDPALHARVEECIRRLARDPARAGRNDGFEVATTYYRITGRRELLDQAISTAAVIEEDFRVNDPPFSGGERDAINCVQLYRVTHDKRHLDLAKHYLDIRGRPDSVGRSRHNQSYAPVLEQREAVGHAVNCASLAVSLVDVGVLTGLQPYIAAGQRMWQDAVDTKFYVTGGIGSTGNEGFGEPYVLPNIAAYAETCAVLMFITLNHRLFLATGDSQYIDVMERGMYNNALSGVSTTGDHFFYVNRLSSAGDGRDLRWQHAALECCPPNFVRFLASMPGLVYAQGERDAIYVNLYLSSEASFTVGGKPISLSVKSSMPWEGHSVITVSAPERVAGAIKLRVPAWARGKLVPGDLYTYLERSSRPIRVAVNGKSVPAVPDRSGYLTIDREWREGDRIEIEFPVEVKRVKADAHVRENRGRLAVERGPIVYCAEWPDVPGGRALTALVAETAELKPSVNKSLDGEVIVLDTVARQVTDASVAAQPLRFIPYHLWANRGAGEMSVWLSSREYEIGDVGPAGGLIFYINPNHRRDGWRYLEAAPFDQSLGARWGCFRRAIPGAAGTAIGTGLQNTKDMLAACAESGSAADLCAQLSVSGVGGWFLPSMDELAELYRNLKANGIGDFRDAGMVDNCQYWASTQNDADMAGHIDFADNGRRHGDDKDFPRRVRAIRAI
ncbi:MAG TPA: beta-L-arabinofuranosidase domain-containing protein [Gemmatimonadaceae bacterium]